MIDQLAHIGQGLNRYDVGECQWPELATLATAEVRDAMARPLIVDGRNLLDPVATRAAGFIYEGIGRPRHASPAEPERARDPELQV